jgi:hypothetical protein
MQAIRLLQPESRLSDMKEAEEATKAQKRAGNFIP